MNIITYEKAYCLFPYATLEERRALIVATDGPGQGPAMEKYRERGWEMLLSLSSRERNSRDPSIPFGFRFLGDRHTWTLPLDLNGVALPRAINSGSSALSHDPAIATSWVFKYVPDDGGDVDFKSVEDDRLLYTHLVHDNSISWLASKLLDKYSPEVTPEPVAESERR